jgi:hypothetical protein
LSARGPRPANVRRRLVQVHAASPSRPPSASYTPTSRVTDRSSMWVS